MHNADSNLIPLLYEEYRVKADYCAAELSHPRQNKQGNYRLLTQAYMGTAFMRTNVNQGLYDNHGWQVE